MRSWRERGSGCGGVGGAGGGERGGEGGRGGRGADVQGLAILRRANFWHFYGGKYYDAAQEINYANTAAK